ncbi:unnamed protein product [Ilex paraguariensis]|uniref:Uncharacterized protein n=1 Tax=Ilex paraguariensis TaxID=185542 RepID=A0ABC8U2P4_9AQUA
MPPRAPSSCGKTNMNCFIDLRYLAAPLLNLLFYLLQDLQIKPWGHDNDQLYIDHDHLILKLFFILFIAFATFLFLFTSIKLPLNVSVTAGAICSRAGDFSVPVTLSLLCSIFLSQQQFWVAYPIILCTSAWYGWLSNLLNWFFNQLKGFFFWFYHTLQAIPTLNCIIFFTQEQDHPEEDPPMVDIEIS